MGMVYSLFFCLFSLFTPSERKSSEKEPRYYEIQIHYAEPGRLKYLQNRYRRFAVPLYHKHNIEIEGFWSPTDPQDERVFCLLSYPSQAAWLRSTKDFLRDPKWKKSIEESETKWYLKGLAEFS